MVTGSLVSCGGAVEVELAADDEVEVELSPEKGVSRMAATRSLAPGRKVTVSSLK